MDFYFTDRQYNVIEIASTRSSTEYKLTDDLEKSSIEANTRALTGTVHFDHKNILRAQEMCAVGNYILYKDEQQNDIFMTIMESHSNSTANTIQFTAEDAGVDLLNETVGNYKATKALKFADYFNEFTWDSGWKIGINEISTLTRTLEWSGEESSYDRMQSVATQFGAELYFSFEIDGTSVVKRQMNVVKHRGDSNNETLYVGKELNSITVDSDIYSLVTSIKATGGTPESSETPITLKGYKYTDPDGRFVLGTDGIMRDTVAVQTWSRLRNNDNPNPNKSHLQQVKSYEAVTQATLCQSVLADLKKNNHPAVNYVLDIAYLPQTIAIGDTIHAADDDASLYVSARLLELSKSRSTNINTAVLGDYLIEHDTVSSTLRDLADDVKNMPKSVQYYPWIRYADDADGNGFSMFPQDKAYMAVIYGKTSTPSDNPSDYSGKWQRVVGPNGQDGADGIVGPAGEDGKTSYFHRAYANSLDGKTDFSVTDGNGKSYMGTYSDFIKADSTDPTKYTWALFKGSKGDKGDTGADGLPGKDGVSIKSTVVTYQLGTSGTTKPTSTWSSTVPTLVKGQYLWTKTTWTYSDSTTEDGFSVAYIAKDGSSGSDGLPGKDGTGIKSTVIDYAVSSSGVTKPTTGWSASIPDVAAGQFMWTRTTWSYTDGTNETGYSVAKAGENGANGKDGKDGMPGEKGADGKTSYVHTAWAWSPDGSDRFMTEYPNENLFINSDFLSSSASSGFVGLSTEKYNGSNVALTKSDGTDWQSVFGPAFKIPVSVSKGDKITIQYAEKVTKARSDGTTNILAFVIEEYATKAGNRTHWSTSNSLSPALDSWAKGSATYQIVGEDTKYIALVVLFESNLTGVETASVALMKMELGETATPWTPSPSNNYQAAYPTYRGEYTDFTQADSTNYKDYKWVRVLGETGGEGPAGKDSHTHIAYANSADGKTDFSLADSNRDYVGMYWDYEDAASTDPTKYKWTKTKGKDGTQGIPGPVGPNGKNSQFHQAWADSSDGKTGFSTTISLGKKYLGTYTDYVEADSTDPAKYKWTELVGAIEIGGRNYAYNTANGFSASGDGSSNQYPAGINNITFNPEILGNMATIQFNVVITNYTSGTYLRLKMYDAVGVWASFGEWNDISGNSTKLVQWKGILPSLKDDGRPELDFNTNLKADIKITQLRINKGNMFQDWSPAPEDTDKAIDDANKHTDDAINKLIPPPSSGISYPSNPKKGQQHWLTDANSKPKGLFQYDGTKWVAVPVNADTISANTLNGMTINGVTINGSTINSPNINVPFNNVPTNPDEPEGSPFATFVSGTTKLTSNLNISGNITDGTNKTPQWVKTLVSPQGFSSIISTPDASKALSVVQVSLGSMFLSEWHSDVTANDGFVSSFFKAGDATTYEYIDVLAANNNINSGTVRYTRKGSQVNVGFRFELKNDTGWVALGKIRTGYTPANNDSVGVNCPSLSYRGYSCVVYPNAYGWRLIPTIGQGVGFYQGSISYVTYDDYPYNDAVH